MSITGLNLAQRLSGLYYRKIFSPLLGYILRSTGLQVGRRVIFYGKPSIVRAKGSLISIGDECVLCSRPGYTALGLNHAVSLKTLNPSAKISIGSRVGMSGGNICSATAVFIGDECLLGANATICDTDFHPITSDRRRFAGIAAARSAPVTVGRNVFIGTGSVILKGVTVGDNSVIGAMSLVTSSVPPDVVAAGNPCKLVRKI